MPWYKRILAVFFLLVLTGPTVGLSVHRHFCCGELQQIALTKIKPCCEPDSENEIPISSTESEYHLNSCCSDNSDKMAVGAYNAFELDQDMNSPAIIPEIADYHSVVFASTNFLPEKYVPPLIRESSHNLSFTCIFRI